MEIVLAAVIAAAGLVAAALIVGRRPAAAAEHPPRATVTDSQARNSGAPQLERAAGGAESAPSSDPVVAAPAPRPGPPGAAAVAQPEPAAAAPAEAGPEPARAAAGARAPVPTAQRHPDRRPKRSGASPPAAANGTSAASRDDLEAELRERRVELARMEERALSKEQAAERLLAEGARREQSLDDRARNLDNTARALGDTKKDHVRELERLSGLSAGQARQLLLQEVEHGARHDSARLIRQVEEETRRDADRRARSILAAAMQRLASGHAAETTVSSVALRSDELKGRIIGREGRNIRALETLTGIDFIVDDTPSTVLLSGFDGVRREIARLTLERLLQDGRIHPASIEDAYGQAKVDIEKRIVEVGEQAVLEASVGAAHAELTKLLGKLQYRTSYGQHVLAHSIECSRLAAMIAAELGASVKTARRAALLHDIGKAVTHEIEGPHALVGGQLARRYGESEAVAHAMEAHHNEVEMRTIEAVIVQIADALSGARPGARGESLEHYVKRLSDLETIAKRHDGVEKVYAMQAGREIRVIVRPEAVDDDTATLLSHQIARDLEKELEYPGQIKVTVIRESRAVDIAK